MDIDELPEPVPGEQSEGSRGESPSDTVDSFSGDSVRPPQEADSSELDESDFEDDRDEPFRFDVPDTSALRSARDIFSNLPAKSFWKPFLLAVAYINLRFHATHRACNLFLSVAKIVFGRLGLFTATDKPISTLRTAFSSIGLKEPFLVLPMCPDCRRVYLSNSPIGLRCYNCFKPLF